MEKRPSLRHESCYVTADNVGGRRGTERQSAAEDLVLEHLVLLIVACNNDNFLTGLNELG